MSKFVASKKIVKKKKESEPRIFLFLFKLIAIICQ